MKRRQMSIPVSRIIRLVSRALRYAQDGYSPQEIQLLIVDLLTLAAELSDALGEANEPPPPRRPFSDNDDGASA
jgi:hypothetical protein